MNNHLVHSKMESVKTTISDHPVAVMAVVGVLIILLIMALVGFCCGWKSSTKKDPDEEELDKLIDEVNSKQT